MHDLTINEMEFVLKIFKSPNIDYNANSIAKELVISSMGALKIAKRLEKEEVLVSKQLGRAKFYKLNYNNPYAKQYLRFLLKRECEQSHPYLKYWVNELKKIKSAYVLLLYGSVLKKKKEANDIDVLLITDKRRFQDSKKEIDELNLVNVKRVHPLYQTKSDFRGNMVKGDKILLNAIQGIVVLGEDRFISLLER